MDYQALTIVAAFAFVYSLVASRLDRAPVNGALVYVIVGFLCSPYVFGLIDIGIVALAAGHTDAKAAAGLGLSLPLQAIGIGALVGIIGGALGSQALRICSTRDWVTGTWLQIPVIALALLCFGTSQWLGGSGFIACFVGGLVFGGLAKKHKREHLDAAEGIGDAMALVTWFVFGAAAIGLTWQFWDWRVIVYALLSLTVVRMLPVLLCVFGLKLRFDTTLFLGWFGPRGLASIVFIVMVLAEDLPNRNVLLTTVVWAVLLSIVLHGLSANWLSAAYGAKVAHREGMI